MRIVGKCKGGGDTELGKRFCVPGIRIKDKCPKCGAKWEMDLGDDYLSYPRIGAPYQISGYCSDDACQTEWTVGSVVVGITITAAKE